MKRTLLLAAALGVLLGFAQPATKAQAAVRVGFSMALVPSSRVYYAQDADEDLYFYDNAWYCVEDGVWYTSDSYQGPFAAVGFSSVPYEIRNVPVSYRRHWEGYTAPVQRYDDATQNRGGWNQNRADGNQGGTWGDRNAPGDRGSHGRGQGANGDRGSRGRGNSNRGGRGWGR